MLEIRGVFILCVEVLPGLRGQKGEFHSFGGDSHLTFALGKGLSGGEIYPRSITYSLLETNTTISCYVKKSITQSYMPFEA